LFCSFFVQKTNFIKSVKNTKKQHEKHSFSTSFFRVPPLLGGDFYAFGLYSLEPEKGGPTHGLAQRTFFSAHQISPPWVGGPPPPPPREVPFWGKILPPENRAKTHVFPTFKNHEKHCFSHFFIASEALRKRFGSSFFLCLFFYFFYFL